jgi:copper resistance protein C
MKHTRTIAGTLGACLLLTLGILLGSVLGPASPAFAHNYLVTSTPEAGSTATELPKQFSVTTNENLDDLNGNGSGFGIDIIDAAGLYYGDGCVKIDGPTLSTDPVIGAAGKYRFVWQVISDDGHPVSNEFTFEWAPSADFVPSVGSKKPGDCNGLYARSGVAETSAPTNNQPIAPSDVLWIGGIIVAVGVAVGAVLLFVRPRARRED